MGQNAAMRSRRRLHTILAVSMVLTAIAGVVGWVAVGRIADATQLALLRMESALVVAKDLADTTASSASELEQVVAVVGEGLANTSTAVGAMADVSENVRKILGIIDFIGSVGDLNESLLQTEQSLVFVQGSLNTASTTLEQAGPALHETVLALAAVPDEIDAAIEDAALARARVDDQVWLFRLGIVAACLGLIGLMWAVRENGRRVDSLLAAVSTPVAGV